MISIIMVQHPTDPKKQSERPWFDRTDLFIVQEGIKLDRTCVFTTETRRRPLTQTKHSMKPWMWIAEAPVCSRWGQEPILPQGKNGHLWPFMISLFERGIFLVFVTKWHLKMTLGDFYFDICIKSFLAMIIKLLRSWWSIQCYPETLVKIKKVSKKMLFVV